MELFQPALRPIQPGALAAPRPSARFDWLLLLWIIVLAPLPLAILAGAEDRDRAGLLLSLLNVAIIGSAIVYFVRKHNFPSLVPVLFLAWLFFSWPSGSIYMGLFNPEARYVLVDETYRRCLDGNERLQSAVLVHVCAYLLAITLFAPRSVPLPDFGQRDRSGTRLGLFAVLGTIFATTLHATAQLSPGSTYEYLGAGAFIYLNGFPLIVGALFPRVPVWVRLLLMGHLVVVGLFYLVGGWRTHALVPFMLLVLGIMFYSAYSQKFKFLVAVLLLLGMPIMLVLGETTQRKTQVKGYERFEERAATLKSEWRQNLGEGSALGRTFGRTFFTGGHSIITLTPESYEYLAFSPGDYLTEFLTVLFIPGRIYSARYYSTPVQLKRYGFRINEKTSVELSLLGGLWVIGGWIPLIVFSLIIGVVHSLVMRWLNKATMQSPYKGLFFLALIAYQVFWGHNFDFIGHMRTLLYAVIAAALLWHFVVVPTIGPVRAATQPVMVRCAPRFAAPRFAARPSSPQAAP